MTVGGAGVLETRSAWHAGANLQGGFGVPVQLVSAYRPNSRVVESYSKPYVDDLVFFP